MRRIRVWSAATGVLVALLVTMLANATLVVAHGATPAPEHGPVTALPVAIHAGYCGGVGDLAPDPVYNLGTLGPTVEPAGETLEPEDIRGVQLSPPVLTDETIIDATFDDLLNGPHAVVVHESPENFDTFVACGELGGVVSDGELQIGLRPLNASRYYGVAVLEKDEGTPLIGEDKTKVTVYVFQDVGPAGPLGPGMTPAAEEASRPTATPTR